MTSPCHLSKAARGCFALAVCLLAALGIVGCDDPRKPAPTHPEPPPQAKAEEWTAGRINEDPEGYIQWADRQLVLQRDDRERRLEDLSARLTEVAERRDAFLKNVAEIRNLNQRLTTAYRRADDEDRWPLKVAGAEFDKRTARAIIERTEQYVEERAPLEADYERGNARLQSAVNTLRSEIADLERLRERLALDLERVRLNKGIQEIDQLRQTEADIRAYAQVLRNDQRTSGDLADLLDAKTEPAPIDVEMFLKEGQ